MELALYCPNCGYYETVKDRLGKGGDFFTSVSVGGLFGELLAFQFAEWLKEMGSQVNRMQIVEAGAHDGRLAADILKWLSEWRRDIFDSIDYLIVEPSDKRRDWQRDTLRGFNRKVQWVERLSKAIGVEGIIFSNELLDSMPVHLWKWDATNKRWIELGVTVRDRVLAWQKMPLERSEPAARRVLDQLPGELQELLPDGFTTETSPAAERWWLEASGNLRRGKLMTIDYGLSAEEFFAPERRNGTLRSYSNHRLTDDLLANPGLQDLTAHVNFSAIQKTGESAGLKTTAVVSQGKFLTDIVSRTAENFSRFQEWTGARTRQLQTLTHAEHLGRAFQVLVQSR